MLCTLIQQVKRHIVLYTTPNVWHTSTCEQLLDYQWSHIDGRSSQLCGQHNTATHHIVQPLHSPLCSVGSGACCTQQLHQLDLTIMRYRPIPHAWKRLLTAIKLICTAVSPGLLKKRGVAQILVTCYMDTFATANSVHAWCSWCTKG